MRAPLFSPRLLRPIGCPSLPRKHAPICKISPPHIRRFHATRPAQSVDAVVSLAHDFIQGVHSITGLPWVASIPLTALTVRLCILPVQIYSMKKQRKLRGLDPILISWGRTLTKRVMDDAGRKGEMILPGTAQNRVNKELKQKRRQLYRRWRVHPLYGFLPLVQLPFWLAIMESLRRMVGMNAGLVGLLFKTSDNTIPVAESMSTEGAFWFTNLLAPDPYFALPLLLSSTLFANITWGFTIPTEQTTALRASLQTIALKAIRSGLQALAIWIGPSLIIAKAPAGIVYYWLSGSLIAIVQNQLLKKIIMRGKVVKPATPMFVSSVPRSVAK